MKLKNQITEIFPKEPKPKHSLSDAIVLDDWGKRDNFFEEKWNDWTEIEDWQINDCPYVFTYLEFEDSIYYLPRYLVFILDDMDGKVSESLCGEVGFSVFNWIVGNWNKIKETLGLEKTKLIREVLLKAKQDQNYSLDLEATGINPDLYKL